MTTIQILKELQGEQSVYRAISDGWHAAGATAGAALDALEALLPDDMNAAAILIQRFTPDTFFAEAEQARLQVLMEQLQLAKAEGHELAPVEMLELEDLINAELRATVLRAEALHAGARD